MFSLQRFFSRDDKFFDLMEGSAQESRAAIQILTALLRAPGGAPQKLGSIPPVASTFPSEMALRGVLCPSLVATW